MASITNIDLATFRRFLTAQGLSYAGTTGGHEKWKKAGMLRPIIFQTHIDPLPVHVVLNNLRTLGIGKKEFLDSL